MDYYEPSIGVNFMSKQFKLNSKKLKLQFWDISGQKKFRALIPSYIKASDGIILIYDITNKESFNNLNYWINFVHNIESNTCIILIGNKCDLESERMVTTEEGNDFALKHGMKFFETSAKNSININEAFYKLAENIIINTNLSEKEEVKEELLECCSECRISIIRNINNNEKSEDKVTNLDNYDNKLGQENKNIIQIYTKEIKNYLNNIEKNLNNKINNLLEENKNLKEKIEQLSNNLNINEIVSLKKRVEDLTEKINRYPCILEKNERLLSIIFTSVSEKFNYSMICKNTDTINNIEEKLYKNFPELSEVDINFLYKGKIINKEQKFEEINIKNSDIIVLKQKQKE